MSKIEVSDDGGITTIVGEDKPGTGAVYEAIVGVTTVHQFVDTKPVSNAGLAAFFVQARQKIADAVNDVKADETTILNQIIVGIKNLK